MNADQALEQARARIHSDIDRLHAAAVQGVEARARIGRANLIAARGGSYARSLAQQTRRARERGRA